ncbi:hypothetical protein C7Y47_14740 [Lysinibacillus sphaericus]|uniref:Uncharacterized protein n=1 Tax=Lysinibacillus sphaericus TaxID=1421 RepID=A0A544UFB4_LYSSH|nr:hypothetical protein [Lysinibacillus sp. SDF0037]TQR31236.1 hypothetical protein C7Y47_14740 [Lysinibacillus sp. SDF0037]
MSGFLSYLIKFLGLPERFLGKPDLLHGLPERFIGKPDLLHGLPERFIGKLERFPGLPDLFLVQLNLFSDLPEQFPCPFKPENSPLLSTDIKIYLSMHKNLH